MSEKLALGRRAEQMVADYLSSRGFFIVARNFHSRYGEIDIIAEDDTYILFVEVKARRAGSMVLPQEAVDAAKRRKICLTAQWYLQKSRSRLQPRFDVAAVTVEQRGGRPAYRLHYVANAFQPEDAHGLF